MTNTFRIAFCSMLASIGMFAMSAHAETVPCEDMLSELRAKVDAATLADADKAQVDDLMNKGIERCNADDDKRADDFFTQAMALVGQ